MLQIGHVFIFKIFLMRNFDRWRWNAWL